MPQLTAAPPLAPPRARAPQRAPADADMLAMLRASLRGRLGDLPVGAGTAAVWPVLRELGVIPQGVALAVGGLAAGLLVAEELGRRALAAPWADGLAAAHAGLALEDRPLALAPAGTITLAGARASGTSAPFPWPGEGAAALLATAEGWAVVAPDAPGLRLHRLTALNAEGQLARLELDAAPAERLPVSPAAAADALLVARLALLARALGAARAGFDLALEHARTRTQFGQPIGRFQAVQHKLANSFIALEGATAHLAAVAEAHDGDAAGWQARAEAALLFAGPALRQVALDNHHVLGAIGYAEEHAAPHLTRRIEIDTTLLGGTAAAREALAAHVIDRAAPLVAPGAGPADGFRQELRHWLGQHWGPAQRAANLARPFSEQNWDAAFARALGEAGLTTLTWPQAAGGRGASPLEKLAFLEETQAVAAPVQHTTVASWIVGPELLVHGNPRLCAALLEPIRRGEVSFCLGYSEPGAGSDLAALATRARREGDEYVISGHKLWNTDGHRASHIILAARTDPDARPRHAGISLFLIPMDTPGISVRPGMAFYGHHFSEILLDEVRVVDWMRLGPENGGWQILGKALANERIIMASFGTDLAVLLDAMMAAARAQGLLADGATRARLATLAAEVETARLLALGAILPRPDGPAPMVAAAVGKVFAGELGEALAQAGIELLGPAALLSQGEEGALAGGSIEQMLRRAIMMVIGGGTAEIQRNIIALRGLELPK